jgi:fused signal recognition particle receptor
MARSWAELLGDAGGPQETEEERAGFFGRLRDSLGKSRRALTGELAAAAFDPGNAEDWERLEEALIAGDVGVRATAELVRRLEARPDLTDLNAALADEIAEMLGEPATLDLSAEPTVILVVGVNGTGKTTTIGKLAAKLRAEGKTVVLAAGDTFRAAAIEQLKIWGARTGAGVVAGEQGADAAGLAFDALREAKESGADVLIVDTAGRLQNKDALMAELEKIIRVMRKLDETAPHTVLLTLDATTGQNAVNQVEIFGRRAGVTGLVMTKLDGTARGGILVALATKYGLPVHFIGVGEGVDDLEPFSADDFARALVGL